MAAKFWCDRKLTVTVDGPDGEQRIAVDKPFARIGSHPACEVVLLGRLIEKTSLYIHATEHGVFCVGLSKRGRDKPRLSRWLAPDDRVEVGPYEVSVRADGAGSPTGRPTNLEDAAGTVPPFPMLVISAAGQKIAQCRHRRLLSIVGRRHPSTLRIKHERLSATHCVFYWDGESFWVVDLLSSNGTWKDGTRIQVAQLKQGRSVQLEEVNLTFASIVEAPVLSHQRNESDSFESRLAAGSTSELRLDSASEDYPDGWKPGTEDSGELQDVVDSDIEDCGSAELLLDQAFAALYESAEANEQASKSGEALSGTSDADATHCLLSGRVEVGESNRHRYDQLMAELEDRSRQLDRRSSELRELRRQLDADRELLATERRALEAERERWELDSNVRENDLTARIAHLERREQDLEDERRKLADEHEKWSQQQQLKETALAKLREETVAREAVFTARLEEVDQRCAELEGQKAELDAQQQQWQTELTRREERTAAQEHLAADLERRLAELAGERQTFEQQQEQAETDVAARFERIEQREAELAANCELLQSKQRDCEAERDRAQAELRQLAEELDRRQHELEMRAEQLEALGRDLQSEQQLRESELATREEEINGLAEQLARRERQLVAARKEWELEQRRLEHELAGSAGERIAEQRVRPRQDAPSSIDRNGQDDKDGVPQPSELSLPRDVDSEAGPGEPLSPQFEGRNGDAPRAAAGRGVERAESDVYSQLTDRLISFRQSKRRRFWFW